MDEKMNNYDINPMGEFGIEIRENNGLGYSPVGRTSPPPSCPRERWTSGSTSSAIVWGIVTCVIILGSVLAAAAFASNVIAVVLAGAIR